VWIYDIALFAHLVALLAGTTASAVIGLAMRRIRSAATGADALPWHGLCKSTARTFPPAMVVLVATGAYMVHRAWSWSDGWVDVGLAGVVLLGVLGDRVEGAAAGRIATRLARDPLTPCGDAVLDPVWWTAATVNPALVVGIVFVMSTKPSLGGAIAALAVAAVLGAGAAVPLWRRPVSRPATVEG
jgi:hypothetical protein